ncbi:hypothetical protein Tco_1042099 [Tanacetum coccineum]|uniref:Uncharacterized protein n=1 Tax=Tanacetum coccineum TaxID=301880 RepID=A0ABQ5GJ97_9ASTR
MNPIVAQQTALDNALVAPDDRIYPRLPNQEFDEPPSDEEIVSFVKELGYKGDIGSVTEVYTDHMYQHWRTFTNIINKCLLGKTNALDKIRLSRAQILWGMFYKKNVDFVELILEDFMFQIDNKDSSAKRKENMPYPKFSKAIIQHFISKDKSISMRNRMFMHTVRDDSVLGTLKFVAKSDDNQVYGVLIPAVRINQKIQNSNSYKTYLAVATGATTPKKPRKWKKPASPSKKQTLVITEEPAKKEDSQLVFKSKILLACSNEEGYQKEQMGNTHASGKWLGDGVGFQPKVPDKPKGKSIDIHEGTGLKLGVPDVSKANSSDSEYEYWGVSDDDDDDQQGDDERIESDDDKSVDLNKIDNEEETQEDEFVHTPDDYVPTDDETHDVDDEEYHCINEEIYDDVNVELKDVRPANKGKGDEEMNDAEKVIAELEEVNQEVASAQVQDEAQKQTADFIREYSVPTTTVTDVLKQQQQPKKSTEDIRKIKMEQAGKHQETKYTITSSDKHKALYHALMESILKDEDAMDKGVADKLKKRKPDDADRDEYPTAGPD